MPRRLAARNRRRHLFLSPPSRPPAQKEFSPNKIPPFFSRSSTDAGHGGGADGGCVHGRGGVHAVPAPVRQAHPVPGLASALLPRLPLLRSQTLCVRVRAVLILNQHVLRLQSSVRPLEFTPSRAMASSREVAAGSLGCCCRALRASQLLFVEIPTRIKSDPPVAVQS